MVVGDSGWRRVDGEGRQCCVLQDDAMCSVDSDALPALPIGCAGYASRRVGRVVGIILQHGALTRSVEGAVRRWRGMGLA